LTKIFNKPNNQKAIPETLFKELDKLSGFVNKAGAVHFKTNYITTSELEDDESGAVVSVPGTPEGQIFNIEMLKLLGGVAKTIDFDGYPGPCLFFGDRLRGAIMGMRNKKTETPDAV
jgi:hypothetical protein